MSLTARGDHLRGQHTLNGWKNEKCARMSFSICTEVDNLVSFRYVLRTTRTPL